MGTGITVVKCGGEFKIDDETLHRKAFCITQDLVPLWMWPTKVSSNMKFPEVDGDFARRMRNGAAEHQLQMVLVGDVLYDDSIPDDPWDGLVANVDFFEENFTSVPSTANSVRAGSLIMPTTTPQTRTGDVQVYDWQRGDILEGFNYYGEHTVGFLATLYVRIMKGKLLASV